MKDMLSVTKVLEQIKLAGVRFIAGLPDGDASAILRMAERDKGFRVIRVHREDDGISICCALSYGEERAVVVMDRAGFLHAVGSIATIGTELRRPLVMLIGQLDADQGLKSAGSERASIKVLRSLLDEFDIPHLVVERTGEEAAIASLIDQAYSTPRPLAILFGAGGVLP